MASAAASCSSISSEADTEPMELSSAESISMNSIFRNSDIQKAHLQELASFLSSFQQDEAFCDVTIVIQGQRFRAHKLVLASTSGFFRAMFTSGYKESSMEEVTLEETPDLNAERFSLLLEFMYTGELSMSFRTMPDILAVAIYLQVRHAVQACADYINQAFEENKLTFELIVKILSMTSDCEVTDIKKAANRYLAAHFADIFNSEALLEAVTYEYLCDLLDRSDLVVSGEEEVIDAVLSWLKYDWDHRKVYAIGLLGKVRLLLLPLEKITSVFEDRLQDIPECKDLYNELLKYHAFGKTQFVSTILSDALETIQTPRICGSIKVLIAVGNSSTNSLMFAEKHREVRDFRHLNLCSQRMIIRKKESVHMAVVGGNIYRCCGWKNSKTNCGTELMRYDPDNRKWVHLSKMNTERSGFGFASHGRYIYAFGGEAVEPVDNVERYDILRDKWDEVPHLPYIFVPRTPISTGIFKHCIIVSGYSKYHTQDGGDQGVRRLNPVMLFNTVTNVWHTLSTDFLCKNEEGIRVKELTRNKIAYVFVPKTNTSVYLITFATTPSKFTRSRNWENSPTVYEYKLDVESNPSSPKFTQVRQISQKCIPETKLRVFRIEHEVFIVVAGFVYKTSMTISDDQMWDADLSWYSNLSKIDSDNYAVAYWGLDRKYIE